MKLLCFLLLIYTGVREASIYRDFKVSFHNPVHVQNNDDLSGKNNDGFDDRRAFKFKEAPHGRTLKKKDSPHSRNIFRDKADNIRLSANEKPKRDYSDTEKQYHEDDKAAGFLKGLYKLDPVLNALRRQNPNINITILRKSGGSTSSGSSASLEEDNWRDEFNELWVKKQFEAVNSTDPRGDQVNMVAARPSGALCGDPNQHDVPWGNCMLAIECDAEYRIYRGDHFCGRTQYVCCALQVTNYDLYQGFDKSFDDSSLATDSAEKRDRGNVSGPKDTKGKKNHAKSKRHHDRKKAKREIRKKISNIVKGIRTLLNKVYRNSTRHRKVRTKNLKKYVEELKKQFKKDRKIVKDVHKANMNQIDEMLAKKLEDVRMMNRNFLLNSTFREILINGTLTKDGTRMLAEAYPELTAYLPKKWLRRDGGGEVDRDVKGETKDDYLEYDIEYGALYY